MNSILYHEVQDGLSDKERWEDERNEDCVILTTDNFRSNLFYGAILLLAQAESGLVSGGI